MIIDWCDVLIEFWNINFRDTFEDLSHLKQLCLSHNYLKKIETEAFSPLTSLEILIMDNNQLEDINGVLMVLVNLKYLSLVNNNVKWFDVAFFPKSVQMINIGRNKIEGHYLLRSGLDISNSKCRYNKFYFPTSTPCSFYNP